MLRRVTIMLISELRAKLAEIEAEHGDLECYLDLETEDIFFQVKNIEADHGLCTIQDY